MKHYVHLFSRAIWPLLAIAALVALAMAPARVPARAQTPGFARQLDAEMVDTPEGPVVRVVAPERFALTIDGAGIVAWYDLAADPGQNLVAPGARLVEHQDGSGAPFVGAAQLVAHSPVRAVVRLSSATSDATISYTIWAGGQVAIEGGVGEAPGSTLRLAPSASSGAVLQPLGAEPSGVAMLYLSAWTPDDAGPGDTGLALAEGATLAAAPGLDAMNTLAVQYGGAGALRLTPPAGVVRQPRFRVAGWPGTQVQLSLAGHGLVAGVDYLADWEAATGELTVQYLGLLTPGEQAARTFAIEPAQEATLSLELLNRAGTAARTLAPDGLLRVDANLPAMDSQSSPKPPAPGGLTTKDLFDIPYIQTWPELRLRATVSSPPAGFGGVRFVVSGPGFSASLDDTTATDGYSALIRLPRRAEYSVTAQALVGGQPADPSKSIARVAYGRVFVSIGDSITAGKWGFYREPGQDGYPFSRPPGAGYPQSADSRNYPQQDNFWHELVNGTPTELNNTYAGYQMQLNDALAQCLNSPVFILNDGISGIRTARDSYKIDNPTGGPQGAKGTRNILGKAAALRSHFSQLGAEQVLLQTGTNDASTVTINQFNDPLPPSLYNQDLRNLLGALRQDNPALAIWMSRLPWRDDGSTTILRDGRKAQTVAYNAEIAEVVSTLATTSSTYLGPDFYSLLDDGINRGLIVATSPQDGGNDRLHPSAEGFTAMAGQWAQTICAGIAAEPPASTIYRLYLPFSVTLDQ